MLTVDTQSHQASPIGLARHEKEPDFVTPFCVLVLDF